MIGIIFLLLLAVPIVELWLIVRVAGEIGVLETIVLLLLISAAGAWLLRQQGTAAWLRLQQALARGDIPTREVTDGALILFGGALLLTPGFVTDVVGLVFLIPITRAAVKGGVAKVFARWARRRSGARIYSARVIRVQRNEPVKPPEDPRAPLESGEGDSPGN